MPTIIYNNIIPLKGYTAVTLWPLVFARKSEKPLKRHVENHEKIHLRQQLEMLLLPFYLWYVLEYLLRLAQYRNADKAYRNISFEREAYANESNTAYLVTRKHYAWRNYIT